MQRKAVKCYVSIPEMWQHLSHRCHTGGKGPHQEKQCGKVERKMTFKFSPFFFFSSFGHAIWSDHFLQQSKYLEFQWPVLTGFTAQWCLLGDWWWHLLKQCVTAHSWSKGHIRENAVQQILTRAQAQSFWNQARLCKGLKRPHSFSSSASSPLCAHQKRRLPSPALVPMDSLICTRLRRRAGYSVQQQRKWASLSRARAWEGMNWGDGFTSDTSLQRGRKLIWERMLQIQLESQSYGHV